MIPIARLDSEFGEIEVLEYRARKLFYYVQGGCFQSEADRNGIGLAPYVHAIFGLLMQSKAQDVLMIGCGGGSLGTMLVKAGVQVAVVDKNPVAFEIARSYFCLPAAVTCHVADGKEFLLGTHRRYDAIVLDAYDGDRIPPHLQTSGILRCGSVAPRWIQRLLRLECPCPARSGQDAGSIRGDRERHVARRSSPRHAGVISRNALVVAGNVRNLRQPSLRMPPLLDRREITSALARMNFRPWKCK